MPWISLSGDGFAKTAWGMLVSFASVDLTAQTHSHDFPALRDF